MMVSSLDKDVPLSRPVKRMESAVHTQFQAGFIATMSGFRFSVHTTPSICADVIFVKDRAELMVQFTLPKNP